MPDPGPILVTGGTGQLASALAAAPGVIRVGRSQFDFDRPETIATLVQAVAPRVVVNAAATPRSTRPKPMPAPAPPIAPTPTDQASWLVYAPWRIFR